MTDSTGPLDTSPTEPQSSAPASAQAGDIRVPELDLPGTPNAEGWRRLHPFSPVLRGGLFFLVLVGIVIANFRDRLVQLFMASEGADYGQPGDIIDLYEFLVKTGWLLAALGGLVAIIMLVVLFSWIGWRFHTYRITSEAVESRKGVVFRQHRRAPLDRVQSVNLQRSLLARVFGLTKIDVLTGGQGGKVELSYIGHRDAKTVREQILRLAAARRDGHTVDQTPDLITGAVAVSYDGTAYSAPTGALTERAQDFVDFDVDPEAAANHSLVRVPVGRLFGSIALSWEVFTIVVLLVIAATGGTIFAVLGLAQQDSAGTGIGVSALFTVIPLILVFISVVFSMFNKGFNFTLSRGRDSVRIGSGLTSTTTDSIPFGRIHAIEARQPLMWRPFGWWKVRVTVAGHSVAEGGQNGTQNVVLPVGARADVVRVIETLVPGTATGIDEGLTGDGAGYLGAGHRAGWLLWFGRRRAGIRIDIPEHQSSSDEATLRIRRGFLTRSLSIMPIVRAQSVQLSRPMVHYWLGLAAINAHTVLGPVRMAVRGLDHARAVRFFEELTETMLSVQLAESAERFSHEQAEPHEQQQEQEQE